jgi:phosphopantothenoylcysteine decarboxylase/phosphopantothenate--cysteine ligase
VTNGIQDSTGALRGARVLLGVTGGIATYKAVEVARLLGKAGAQVQVVMTDNATRFVGEATFAAITHRPVHVHTFEEPHRILHVQLARGADVVLVAPATANVLAKMAGGVADDLLTNVLMMARCPVVVAPAMHTEMWEHASTRVNLETLRERGVIVIDPEAGDLAGGDEGVGRLAEPPTIVEALGRVFARGHDLAGLHVLVTAGGTQEPIDPVRFLTNRSSGKMGYAIAAEAARRGAHVTLVSAPTKLDVPPRVEHIDVRTTLEMHDAVLARFDDTHVVILAAAVSDFRPVTYTSEKIKKDGAEPTIALTVNPDIAADLGRAKRGQLVFGFAAETNDHIPNARKKLAAKNMDLIVVNDVARRDIGFDVDYNEVVFLGPDGSEDHLPLQLKTQVARAICDRVVDVLRDRDQEENA